ncbi:MAG: DUF421 domain-containing protein, partial [Clostridiales bacterium]|nr:DUF421 domain-containing protein [Clostridiales bacterium]
MLIVLFRTVILYIAVIFFVRLMGKRQIGELQPSELVITILISEVVSIPMQDSEIPLISGIIPAAVLVALEIFFSFLNMRFKKLREVMQGHSIIIIRQGIIDQKQLKLLRMTVDDLMESLRKKDVFDINTVNYAIIETDGSLSVMLKPEYQQPTASMMKLKAEDNGFISAIIIDGKILDENFKECSMTEKKLNKIISSQKIPVEKIFLMLADSNNY